MHVCLTRLRARADCIENEVAEVEEWCFVREIDDDNNSDGVAEAEHIFDEGVCVEVNIAAASQTRIAYL